MAPAIAIAMPASGNASANTAAGKRRDGESSELERLRRRNAELEGEVAATRAELEAARSRLRATEDAEERLCVQLGEVEAEAVELALAYRERVEELVRELAAARRIAGAGVAEKKGVDRISRI